MSLCVFIVCPDRDRPGSSQGHPRVSGSHGNVAGLSHHNLQVSPEGSRGANDRMETVTNTKRSLTWSSSVYTVAEVEEVKSGFSYNSKVIGRRLKYRLRVH